MVIYCEAVSLPMYVITVAYSSKLTSLLVELGNFGQMVTLIGEESKAPLAGPMFSYTNMRCLI
jgi:hypothetical protein